MKILIATSEAVPYAKTGGLADVAGALVKEKLSGTPRGDYADNASRFIFFSRGVLEACKRLSFQPDVIHCNDWQTGLIPLYLKTLYKLDPFFRETASLLTIHNLGYQGLFPAPEMPLTGLGREIFNPEGIEFYGKMNFLKAGIISADVLTTVSNTYAKEVLQKEFAFGLEGVLTMRENDLFGVTKGIDYDEVDRCRDTLIPEKFSSNDLRGRAGCTK